MIEALKHVVNTSRFSVIMLIYQKNRLSKQSRELFANSQIANQNLTGNVLKTILNINNVKE